MTLVSAGSYIAYHCMQLYEPNLQCVKLGALIVMSWKGHNYNHEYMDRVVASIMRHITISINNTSCQQDM